MSIQSEQGREVFSEEGISERRGTLVGVEWSEGMLGPGETCRRTNK